jgi:radical SAM family RiPP maturation amino acid epimerase
VNTHDVLRAAGLHPTEPADVAAFAQIKRFGERWRGDHRFREAYPSDPKALAEAYGLDVDPDWVRRTWDVEGVDDRALSPVAVGYQRFVDQMFATTLPQRSASDDAFARWRQRQMYRHMLEAGIGLSRNPHIPASFELTKGCSLGCWFCSLNPPKLADQFLHTPDNARLWRGVLQALQDIVGPAASDSICYSGTDPFDNPDYELFAADFEATYGESPATSTALGARHPERLRRLMARFGPHNVRLSILSLAMLNKIHAAFTPEELLLTRVSFRNEGSLEAKQLYFSGRARERAKTYEKYRPDDPIVDTSSCETGFRFNMPDRMVRLCSPCAPDDRWPNGYRVYDESRFESADEARQIMRTMIERHMPMTLPDETILSFHRVLRFEATAEGFALAGPHLRQRFANTAEQPFLRRLAELISQGRHTASGLAAILAAECGASRDVVDAALDDLFRLGAIDDEPAAPQGQQAA